MSRGWMRKGSLYFFNQRHLGRFRFHPLNVHYRETGRKFVCRWIYNLYITVRLYFVTIQGNIEFYFIVVGFPWFLERKKHMLHSQGKKYVYFSLFCLFRKLSSFKMLNSFNFDFYFLVVTDWDKKKDFYSQLFLNWYVLDRLLFQL